MSQELEGTLTNSANLVGTFGSEGGGGTSNYNDLINKPSINSVTLQGNKTAAQLGLVSSTDLAAVATSGNYNDLTNKPTIPAAQVNSDWNASSGVAEILNKPTLAAVATSGAYSDLTGTPTIPAAQVNSDWNASSGVAEILNKPTVYQNAAELPVSSSDPTDTKSYIDTGLSGKVDNATLDYFINERPVGKWIDDKTIYRCVFTGFNMSTTANTWAETTVSASNLSTLIYGRAIDSSGQSFACSLGWSNQKVAINMPLARSNLTTLILEYTKT